MLSRLPNGAAIEVVGPGDKGQMDRFRSQPMSRAAVVVGQTLFQLLKTMVGVAGMVICALASGWSIHSDPPRGVAGFGLIALLALATT